MVVFLYWRWLRRYGRRIVVWRAVLRVWSICPWVAMFDLCIGKEMVGWRRLMRRWFASSSRHMEVFVRIRGRMVGRMHGRSIVLVLWLDEVEICPGRRREGRHIPLAMGSSKLTAAFLMGIRHLGHAMMESLAIFDRRLGRMTGRRRERRRIPLAMSSG